MGELKTWAEGELGCTPCGGSRMPGADAASGGRWEAAGAAAGQSAVAGAPSCGESGTLRAAVRDSLQGGGGAGEGADPGSVRRGEAPGRKTSRPEWAR